MTTPLLAYQETGADILAKRDLFGLHDEMGVGKTATVIGAVDRIRAKRGIVVAPAMVREHWLGEFRKFSPEPHRICKARTHHDYVAWKKGRFNFLITSYEMAAKWAKDIAETPAVLDFVAYDEAHYLKSTGAERTKKLLGKEFDNIGGIAEMAVHAWHVTGTPMTNDPADIYPFLKMTRAIPGMTFNAFINTFFHVRRGMYSLSTRARDDLVPELKALIENNRIRRLKQDVGIHLPPIFLTTALVDGDTDEIKNMLRDHPGLESAIVHAIEMGGLSFLDAQHIATLRRLVGAAKAIPYADMLLDELKSGVTDKRVVFGNHRDALVNVCRHINNGGYKAVLVYGDTSEKDRIEARRAFQNDEDCRVFVGNMTTAGAGIDLYAACEIDVLESDWTPGKNAQAIMRVHRMGQTRKVRARFITLSGSIDEVVNKVVAAKTAAIAQIEGQAMQSSPLDVLQQYLH